MESEDKILGDFIYSLQDKCLFECWYEDSEYKLAQKLIEAGYRRSNVPFELRVINDKNEYRIRHGENGWKFYIENEHEEGMSLSEKEFFDMLDKHFKDSF